MVGSGKMEAVLEEPLASNWQTTKQEVSLPAGRSCGPLNGSVIGNFIARKSSVFVLHAPVGNLKDPTFKVELEKNAS